MGATDLTCNRDAAWPGRRFERPRISFAGQGRGHLDCAITHSPMLALATTGGPQGRSFHASRQPDGTASPNSITTTSSKYAAPVESTLSSHAAEGVTPAGGCITCA